MKLMHPLLSRPLELGRNRVPVLAVEAPQLFRQWALDLSGQSQGEEGSWVLSCQDEVLDCGQHLLVVSDLLHLSLEDRKLHHRFQTLVQSLMWEELEVESTHLQQSIQGYLARLASQIPVPVEYGEGDAVWPLLKGLKFQPVLDGVSPLERLTQYLELYHQLIPRPCVLLVGMHLYFSRQELEQFYQMALYEKWNVLVLEPHQCPPQPQEQWCIIDHDGCELRVDSPGEIP